MHAAGIRPGHPRTTGRMWLCSLSNYQQEKEVQNETRQKAAPPIRPEATSESPRTAVCSPCLQQHATCKTVRWGIV